MWQLLPKRGVLEVKEEKNRIRRVDRPRGRGGATGDCKKKKGRATDWLQTGIGTDPLF